MGPPLILEVTPSGHAINMQPGRITVTLRMRLLIVVALLSMLDIC